MCLLLRRTKQTNRFGTDTNRRQEGDRSQDPADFLGRNAQFQRAQAEACVRLRNSRRLSTQLGKALPDRARVVLGLVLENGASLAEAVGFLEQAAQLLAILLLLRREIEVHLSGAQLIERHFPIDPRVGR